MSKPENDSVRVVTLPLPDGRTVQATIEVYSVVVVPVPPRPRSPGDLYMIHTPTPEASIEVRLDVLGG
ncbi:hypothetical protein [Arenimonas caeni]|uniref:Uncharacterized protein n=1 Tax=Arenimonas caeni TaxID=2058085 RepID=A0A2P6M6E5_9GAMM|nr:hypothetical protein [Arenimonas caeni]PRH81558.1 hypothetical protein C6N40_12140 [Arenimonas caeni]